MSTTENVNRIFTFEKSVIQSGTGKYQPIEFSHCKVIIRVLKDRGTLLPLSNADVIGCPVDEETDIIIGLGKTCIACVIEQCLQTMKVGEKCLISTTVLNSQTNCFCPVELELELLSYNSDTDVHLLSDWDKIMRACVLKEIGAAAFRADDVPVAFHKFSRSLKYLSCIINTSNTFDVNCDDFQERYQMYSNFQCKSVFTRQDYMDLLCHSLLNISACQLRHGNYEMAKINCTRAVSVDPENVKGLYRRARCNIYLGEPYEAVQDLEKAVQLDPNNHEIARLLKTAKEAARKSDETLAKAMGKMFGKS